jgi:hypothetical protein
MCYKVTRHFIDLVYLCSGFQYETENSAAMVAAMILLSFPYLFEERVRITLQLIVSLSVHLGIRPL